MLKARTKEQESHNIMVMSVLEFISKITGRSDLLPLWCIEAELAAFELQDQLSMSLFGHSEIGGTRTVCQQHKMCCFEECYQVLRGYHRQKPENAKRG